VEAETLLKCSLLAGHFRGGETILRRSFGAGRDLDVVCDWGRGAKRCCRAEVFGKGRRRDSAFGSSFRFGGRSENAGEQARKPHVQFIGPKAVEMFFAFHAGVKETARPKNFEMVRHAGFRPVADQVAASFRGTVRELSHDFKSCRIGQRVHEIGEFDARKRRMGDRSHGPP